MLSARRDLAAYPSLTLARLPPTATALFITAGATPRVQRIDYPASIGASCHFARTGQPKLPSACPPFSRSCGIDRHRRHAMPASLAATRSSCSLTLGPLRCHRRTENYGAQAIGRHHQRDVPIPAGSVDGVRAEYSGRNDSVRVSRFMFQPPLSPEFPRQVLHGLFDVNHVVQRLWRLSMPTVLNVSTTWREWLPGSAEPCRVRPHARKGPSCHWLSLKPASMLSRWLHRGQRFGLAPARPPVPIAPRSGPPRARW